LIIQDYTHFDQAAHGLGAPPAIGLCPLYSNNNELHVQNVIAAGEKAKQELAKKGVSLKHDPTKVAPQVTAAGGSEPDEFPHYADIQVIRLNVLFLFCLRSFDLAQKNWQSNVSFFNFCGFNLGASSKCSGCAGSRIGCSCHQPGKERQSRCSATT
jgi:hypothetical protein